MLAKTKSLVRLIGAISFLAIVIFAALTIATVELTRRAHWWVDHTQQVIGQTGALLALLVNAESGGRGFLITKDDSYLAPMLAAQASAPALIGRLKGLTSDNSGQQARLEGISDLVVEELANMTHTVNAAKAGRLVHTVDHAAMDKIRLVIGRFDEEEQKLYRSRLTTLTDRFHLIYASILLSAVLSVIAAGVLASRLRTIESRAVAMENVARQAQKMEAIGQFTGGIAHDFNNTLQSVITNLDLAVGKLGAEHRASDFIQVALVGLEKGAKLTSQLLSFARRQPLRPEPIAIDRLLNENITFLRRALGEGYDVELVCSGGLWLAMADPHLLVNAVLNLVVNARDAMPDGGKITIEAANATLDSAYTAHEHEVAPGRYVMVAVSDTGSGMAPETISRAFEPFYTTKAHGTGLGLAMVYGFVKQSCGHVKIYAEQGEGTTVKIYIPKTNEQEVAKESQRADAVRGRGQTILVVEDDDSVRVGVVSQLTELGYKVLSAADGLKALDLVDRDPSIELLFTDVVLGKGLNGRELADKAQERRPNLPVVYTSGYTENAIVHRGRLDEGAILLSKPYRLSDLAQVVAQALTSTALLSAASPAVDQRSILIVEDDELIRTALALTLEGWGWRSRETATATEALTLLAEQPHPAWLITDLGLPDISGLDLAKTVRGRFPAIGVIIMSGLPPMPEALDAVPGPRPQWLMKPFKPEILAAVVKAVPAPCRGVNA